MDIESLMIVSALRALCGIQSIWAALRWAFAASDRLLDFLGSSL